MAIIKETLTDIAAIGTKDDPVARIYVTEIFGCKNISEEESTVPVFPETQDYKGIELEPGKVIIKEISEFKNDMIIGVNSISGAGTGGLDFPGGGANAKITGTFIVTELMTAGGGIAAGGHFAMGTWNISGAGGNNGLGFLGATAIFSDPVNINDLLTMGGNIKIGGYYFSYDGTNTCLGVNPSNEAVFYTLLRATKLGESILATANIRTNGVFAQAGNTGISTTIDLSGIGGPVITVSGGIITNVV